MAQILSFRTPESRTSDEAGRRERVSAEVILFPGVRYERWSEREEAMGARDQLRIRRDVLELAE